MQHRFRLSVRLSPSLEPSEYVLTHPKFGDKHFLVPATVYSGDLLDGIRCGGVLLFLAVFSYPSTPGNRPGDLLVVEMELRIPYRSQYKHFYTFFWGRDRNLDALDSPFRSPIIDEVYLEMYSH